MLSLGLAVVSVSSGYSCCLLRALSCLNTPAIRLPLFFSFFGKSYVVVFCALRLPAPATRYLLATICFVEANVEVARTAGCLRAVLSCFSRHSGVKEVYDNFREVGGRAGYRHPAHPLSSGPY